MKDDRYDSPQTLWATTSFIHCLRTSPIVYDCLRPSPMHHNGLRASAIHHDHLRSFTLSTTTGPDATHCYKCANVKEKNICSTGVACEQSEGLKSAQLQTNNCSWDEEVTLVLLELKVNVWGTDLVVTFLGPKEESSTERANDYLRALTHMQNTHVSTRTFSYVFPY